MYWLIETEDQLEEFSLYFNENIFIEIIPYNHKDHPVTNKVCSVYLRPLNSNKGYIINVDHSEALSLSIDKIENTLKKINTIFTRDKKELLHYFIHKNIIDLTLDNEYNIELTKTHHYFNNIHPDKFDINRIIPIVKHYQYCENIFNDLKKNTHLPVNKFYNDKATLVFNYIEKNGIKVNKDKFEEKFHKINNNICYTQYNFKTITKRPSNRFKSVNYAALDKNNGDRSCFIPRNNMFIEIDISAYHPTLLSHLINYDFGEQDIHEVFANMYGVSYEESKNITFKQLYGGVFPQYKNLEFFKKVDDYTNELWEEFINKGYITCPISNNVFHNEKLKDMRPSKLLNYLLQSMETANNVNIIWDIIKLLKNKKTKLVLYTFDSILLDVYNKEKDTIKDIIKIFNKYKLNVKIKYGKDYHNMIKY
jgi:hypothetical protein